MRKTSKTQQTNSAGSAATPPVSAAETEIPLPAAPASSPAKKRTAKSTKSSARKTSAKKRSAGRTAVKKASAKRESKPTPAAEPSDSDIRIRAYFLAERRVQQGLLGDSAHDWIEARKQLLEEAQNAPG
ncbi:MAG: DUF2934 domain-containing protein [Chthoniobacterales bacterium]|nr:DUF2934 domain-containing protein [Chthoniobacterales bacterium]